MSIEDEPLPADDVEKSCAKKEVNFLLRNARLKRLWSIKVAAQHAKVSETTYIRWEQGQQNPHLVNLQLLCNAFELEPEELGYGDLLLGSSERLEVRKLDARSSVLAELAVISVRIREAQRELSTLEKSYLHQRHLRDGLQVEVQELRSEYQALISQIEEKKLEEKKFEKAGNVAGCSDRGGCDVVGVYPPLEQKIGIGI